MRTAKVLAASPPPLSTAACANQKDPAENLLRGSKPRWPIPGGRRAVRRRRIEGRECFGHPLKDNLARKDYRAVIQGAPGHFRDRRSSKDGRPAKADAGPRWQPRKREWNELNASAAGGGEVADPGRPARKTRKYRQRHRQVGFEAAKSDFESLKTEWTAGRRGFRSGQAADAVRQARAVKARSDEPAAGLTATNSRRNRCGRRSRG